MAPLGPTPEVLLEMDRIFMSGEDLEEYIYIFENGS